ncbi:MAG: EF-P lysine aminoacylase GenX [Planctomycetaceae bacterium]|nr:EF-P lysine aminoacylase GenX [Planctomycetaceae bacterium]
MRTDRNRRALSGSSPAELSQWTDTIPFRPAAGGGRSTPERFFNGWELTVQSGAPYLPSAELDVIRLRSTLLQAIRRYFLDIGYWEVETPVLSRDVVVDAHLDPFRTESSSLPSAETFYLQTSPEFHMKRLLAAGAAQIFQLSRVMRRGEVGRLHNPEFTMIEWYRVGDTMHEQMACTEGLVRAVVDAAIWQGGQGRIEGALALGLRMGTAPFLRLTYDEAFEQYAGQRVLDCTTEELAALAERHGISAPPGLQRDDRDGWLNLLLACVVEPNLGTTRPVFLYDFPASQSALAQVRDDNPPVAERFELYIGGIELCNGYHELTDPDELRKRIEVQSDIRSREGLSALPAGSRLLEAMDAGLPECSGVALGFDRLVMLAAGKESLAEVMAFPFDRA